MFANFYVVFFWYVSSPSDMAAVYNQQYDGVPVNPLEPISKLIHETWALIICWRPSEHQENEDSLDALRSAWGVHWQQLRISLGFTSKFGQSCKVWAQKTQILVVLNTKHPSCGHHALTYTDLWKNRKSRLKVFLRLIHLRPRSICGLAIHFWVVLLISSSIYIYLYTVI